MLVSLSLGDLMGGLERAIVIQMYSIFLIAGNKLDSVIDLILDLQLHQRPYLLLCLLIIWL